MTQRTTGFMAPVDRYAVPVMFNPYTGEPRDVRDVQSDPQGILIIPPCKVEMLAAKPAQAAQPVQQAQPSQAVELSDTKSLLMPATAAPLSEGKVATVDMSRLPRGAA